ncbi:hypothetical protein P3T25_000348 [Paraburkholderia sp. GAS32]
MAWNHARPWRNAQPHKRAVRQKLLPPQQPTLYLRSLTTLKPSCDWRTLALYLKRVALSM